MKTGFTLIEMLITVATFSLVIGAASGVFVSAIRGQQRTLAFQEVLAQASYIEEYMSRTLRMAKKDLTGNCITQGYNYEITRKVPTGEGLGLQFINYQEECQEFFFKNGQLKERRKIGTPEEETLELTSENIEVFSFVIRIVGEPQDEDPNFQPRVTILLGIRGKGERPEEQPQIKIQTTISQRNLDI